MKNYFSRIHTLFIAISLLLANLSWGQVYDKDIYNFTAADIAFLKKFSLSALPALPPAPSNDYSDNLAAAKLGKALFFDKRLSKNKKISCASCHQPEKYFTDGLAKGKGLGTAQRSTPSLLGVAWSPWQYWDGRKDSLWSQALGPIEHPAEMGLSRTHFVKKFIKYYRRDYEKVFGNVKGIKSIKRLPKKASPIGHSRAQKRWKKMPPELQHEVNTIFTDAGKALMAYQRQLHIPKSRFDHFIDRLQSADKNVYSKMMSESEVSGLRLFMGKANCASCHNGPLFTNYEFHNVGAPEPDPTNIDLGRYSGVASLTKDEFTCLSVWSDADESECEEMTFLKRVGPELVGAFKTPTLRNITATAPYMQSGQFTNLQEVLMHYNLPAPPLYDREQHPNRPHFDILPLNLSDKELTDLLAFLETLTSPYPTEDFWWNQDITRH